MPNGKITLEEFHKFDEPTRQYYIWERLNYISELREEIDKVRGWQKQMIGAMVILNVFVLPIIFMAINKWINGL